MGDDSNFCLTGKTVGANGVFGRMLSGVVDASLTSKKGFQTP